MVMWSDPYVGGAGYVAKNSAVNISTTSTSGNARLNRSNRNALYLDEEDIAALSVYAVDEQTKYQQQMQIKPGTASTAPENKFRKTIPLNYRWNLPPHTWSLPTRPGTVDSSVVRAPARRRPNGNGIKNIAQTNDNANFHGLRRGRIWFWDAANAVENLVGGETKKAEATKITAKEGQTSVDATIVRNWGFQFLWNPETIQSNLVRNMDITPSAADSLRVVSGAFPGQESFSVTIVLDRVNDFACAKGQYLSTDPVTGIATTTNLDKFNRYYQDSYFPNSDASITFSEKMTKLLAQGTMADLEYLFRAINGTLQVDGVEKIWSDLLGKQTANIGYLQPSLMGFQFGPTLDNLAWVGWISNLGINHTMFTENMIPLRTEVTISAEAFTGSGIGAA